MHREKILRGKTCYFVVIECVGCVECKLYENGGRLIITSIYYSQTYDEVIADLLAIGYK